jgi:hypothetical protein
MERRMLKGIKFRAERITRSASVEDANERDRGSGPYQRGATTRESPLIGGPVRTKGKQRPGRVLL